MLDMKNLKNNINFYSKYKEYNGNILYFISILICNSVKL